MKTVSSHDQMLQSNGGSWIVANDLTDNGGFHSDQIKTPRRE